MDVLTAKDIENRVELAISKLPSNPLGFRLRKGGIYKIDGRWWAYLDVEKEPENQSVIWDAVAQIEGILEDDLKVQVSVTAA